MKKILLFLFFSQFLFSQQWSISFAERSALLNLYNSTSGDTWSQTWNQQKDPKHWYGVKIKNGNVIEINLRGNSLKGNFPTISGFSKLQKLDLSSNQLAGPISPTISSFTNLIRLDLSNNHLTGDPSNIILPLTNLEEISLGNNNFAFADINSFLQSFPHVKILDLSHLGLTSVPQKIATLTNLQSLNLSNNKISQDFSNLSTLLSLKDLNLSGNELTKIPIELSTLTLLNSLDVSNNIFAPNYATVLSNLKNLEWLSLANNQIENFPSELSQLKSLIHLNLSDNKLSSGVGNLVDLKELEQIYLDKNLISGAFPSILLQLKKLQMLSLTANQLSGEIPENIPALTFLENNNFTKADIKNFMLKEKILADFTYSPQRYDDVKTVSAILGNSVSLPQSLSGNDYQFTWFKNLDQKTNSTTESYFINKVEESDYTEYTCEAYTFEELPKELLEISFFREPITLTQSLGTDETPQDLMVYPNPTSDFLYIKTTKRDIENVFVFDLTGKLILTEKSKAINVSQLPSSTYIITIKTSEGLKSFKFIKK